MFGTGPWSWFCALPADRGTMSSAARKYSPMRRSKVRNAGDSSITAAVWAQPMSLRANVTDSGPGGTPTGTLTFADATGGGFRPICVDVPLATPTLCTPASTPIDTGTRQLSAAFGGSGTHGAASANRTLTVTPATSVITIANPSPDPVPLGKPFRLAANVALNAPSAGTAYGSIEVHDIADATSCGYELGAVPAGCGSPRSVPACMRSRCSTWATKTSSPA